MTTARCERCGYRGQKPGAMVTTETSGLLCPAPHIDLLIARRRPSGVIDGGVSAKQCFELRDTASDKSLLPGAANLARPATRRL